MTNSPRSIRPLTLCLALSLGLHAAAAWSLGAGWFSPDEETLNRLIRRNNQPEDKLKIGQLAPSPSRMNWISHEDYQKLISAHQAPFDQAAVQDQVQPDPEAQQTPVKPTDPGPRSPQPVPTAGAASEKTDPAASPASEAGQQPAPPASLPVLAESPVAATPARRIELPAQTTAAPAPATQPARNPAPAPAPATQADPTASPLEKRQSPPVTRLKDLRLKPGAVVAREGLRINTVQPQFSTIALLTAAPANPEVEVVFDRKGQVIAAKILKSSGYANVDGPILNSLYRWSAEGPQLEAAEGPLAIQVHIDL